MDKLIVTHIKPHLDEVTGIWLIKKYFPGFTQPKLVFISAQDREYKKIQPDSDQNVLYLGVGRGRFDEHRGLTKKCSTTLVWDYIKKNFKSKFKPEEEKALNRLTEYVYREDSGQLIEIPDRLFSIQNVLWGYYHLNKESSVKMVNFGQTIIETIFSEHLKQVAIEIDWKNKITFDTPWGRGVALEAEDKGLARVAFSKGYQLTISINSSNGYRGIRAPAESEVNLTETYKKIKEMEPEADWYLHQSKKLLLCGGDVAPNAKKSELSLKELVKLVRRS